MTKRHHPDTPIIFGGFSATYYHEELIRYPFVDFVIRGDSAEEPLRQLMAHLMGGQGRAAAGRHPQPDLEGSRGRGRTSTRTPTGRRTSTT